MNSCEGSSAGCIDGDVPSGAGPMEAVSASSRNVSTPGLLMIVGRLGKEIDGRHGRKLLRSSDCCCRYGVVDQMFEHSNIYVNDVLPLYHRETFPSLPQGHDPAMKPRQNSLDDDMLSAPAPRHVDLANILMQDIRDGCPAVGELLPTEAELCAQWGLSRYTVHPASYFSYSMIFQLAQSAV
ncbi:GntR family transcriptional regulator [Pseudomonas schmalbachii]|uniref:GntR family transcriptional regulator n=1 Tax=Pseudomonas schmalbachii TaxID=2816993 RepID=UPI001F3405F0|nr:GntR family transcriptional regulator [Pseudomonas schmalbachii]